MTKVKKIILSISIALSMCIALVIGLISAPKPLVSGGGDYINSSSTQVSNNEVTPVKKLQYIKPQKFTFKEDEVTIQAGGIDLNFEYDPSVNAKATSVAYEYKFSNSMNKLMAVSLKAIDTTGVTVSYAYSDTKLSSVTSTSTPFEAPTINSKCAKYIYIVVSATSSIPTTFTSSIVWYQGEAGELSITANGTTTTQNIVKGVPIETPAVEVPDGYTCAWYLDEECTIPATFPLKSSAILYAVIEKPYPTANLPSDWLAWDSTTNSYYVMKGTSTLPTELVIPKTYNDGTNGEANVTYIYSGSYGSGVFYNQTTLTSVTLPKTLTSIGGYAFQGCSGLTSIDLPNSLTSIGESAFYNCSGLTSITLPSSVTSIGETAFSRCSKLTSITIPASVISIGGSPFSDSGLTSIVVESGNSVYDSRDNCNAIIETSTNTLIAGCKNTTIPSTVTSIGNDAFRGCSGLTSIDLSGCTSLTSIGNYAFYNCSGLTSITIPASVTSIGNYAFYNCSGLTSISLPSSLTSIGNSAFNGCSKLTSITIPANVIKIGAKAFQNSGLTSMTFSDTSTWYRTSVSDYTYGTETDVSDATQNATWFKSTSGYYNRYWYKL